MLVHWIWLAHRPGLSDRMKLELLRHFQEPEAVYFADRASFDTIPLLTPEAKEALGDRDLSHAEKLLGICREKRIHLLTWRDAAYPARLKNIPDPPILLYYKGVLPDIDNHPVIGVVGTRNASLYGMTAAKRMGYQIGKCGGIVVSGMAAGIDAMAMSGCLTAGKPTIGVLGCGVDIVYPRANASLFRDVENFGCILSEFAPGTEPARWTFPKRNRIIAGLSCGVLVVEAPAKSGSLITARQALDQGRDVFVVTGNMDLASFEGSHRLLRDGAIPVFSGWDILSEYRSLYPDKILEHREPSRQTACPDELEQLSRQRETPAKVAQPVKKPAPKGAATEKCDKKGIDKEQSSPYSDLNDKFSGLSGDEAAIVNALREGEQLVDEVIAQTGMTTGKLLSLLTMLELKGIIRRLPGKRISLK